MRLHHTTIDPARVRGRRIVALVAALAVVATPIVSATVGSSPAPAHAATPVETEAPDFASENYADPWDYSNLEDQNTDYTSLRSASILNGKFTMSVAPGDWIDPVDTVGGIPFGRDGAEKVVDSNRYRRLSFSMDQPNTGIGAIYWWTCREKSSACIGGITFPLTKGQHVYDIALDVKSILGPVQWANAPIVAFRLQPVVVPNGAAPVTVSLDWLRLHGGTSAHAAMPPGDYGTYRIEPLPEPVVDSPNPSEGPDLATALHGRPWEFTSATNWNTNGVSLTNASLRGFGSDGVTATNAPPDINDPIVNLPISQFSGSEWHWFSWDMTYDGGFSLEDAPGGGKMARVIWTDAAAPTVPQIGNDMLTFAYVNARESTVDLTALDPLDEDALPPRLGWAGQVINSLRFDPNEDPSAETWHLKSLHVRSDPSAVERTTVKFHDAAWVAGTTATIKVGTGAPGTPYTTIASNLAVTQGSNSTTFALGSLPAGSYRVEVDLYHPNGGGASSYSKTAIGMSKDTSRDPRGSLDSVSGTTSGVTVNGWAFDPDATAGTDVDIYDQTSGLKNLGRVRTSVARPDVARNVKGAPANSGYTSTVTLSAGQHTICAYAINVGSGGQNPLLGCQTVNVAQDTSHDPRGSFDAATSTGTGSVNLSGWTFDPDSGNAGSYAVYDQTSGNSYLGRFDTSVARSDVQRAYPGAPANAGFATTVKVPTGNRTICVYGINVGAGTTNPLLGCRAVTVTNGAVPLGGFDSVSGGSGSATVSGWAWDADAGAAPTEVRVYDQTSGARFVASLQTGATRSDVQRNVAGAPATTGYSGSVPLAAGVHNVCVYAINVPSGDNPLLGCRSVTVR